MSLGIVLKWGLTQSASSRTNSATDLRVFLINFRHRLSVGLWSALATHHVKQPSLGVSPVSFSSSARNLERIGGLLHCQSGEVSQRHQPSQLGAFNGQVGERFVECQQVHTWGKAPTVTELNKLSKEILRLSDQINEERLTGFIRDSCDKYPLPNN